MIDVLNEGNAPERKNIVYEKFGLMVVDLPDGETDKIKGKETNGLLIARIKSGGIADEAGIMEGDVVKDVDGNSVDGLGSFEKAINGHNPAIPLRFLIFRGGRWIYVTFQIEQAAAV